MSDREQPNPSSDEGDVRSAEPGRREENEHSLDRLDRLARRILRVPKSEIEDKE